MDYEKKYKEALERAREWYNKTEPDSYTCIVESIFPELKESEDERIRKELITHCRNTRCVTEEGAERIAKWLAWLEKQSNQTIFNKPSKETILAVWELGNDWKELTKGVISTEHGTQLDYIQKHWSESEHYLREKRKHEPASNEQQGKSALEAIKEEKADNANKVERKFKVGDWIVNQHGTVRHIEEVGNVGYQTDEGWLAHDYYEKDFRLWTIQDAKDRDVLYSLDSKQPFIYKNRKPFNQAEAYCGINIFGKFFVWNTKDCAITLDKYVPATKEQRELLFQKMHEAGYMWDSESKQLLSLEAKPSVEKKNAWSEEDKDF